jgi:regulation of enolase protein 1 (concanavalin A-like superfamily)
MKSKLFLTLLLAIFCLLTVKVYSEDSDNDSFSDQDEKEIYGTNPNDSKSSPAVLPEGIKSVNIGNLGFNCRSYFYKNIFEIKATGEDVWVNTDECRFIYKEVSGNFSVIAKLDSVEAVDQWTKAGIMIRNSIVPYAKNIFLCMTNNKGYYLQARYEPTAITKPVSNTLNNQAEPYWMKLERVDDTIKAYYSRDKEHWTDIGTSSIKFKEKVCVGLALTSHKKGVLATAKFSGFEVKKQ